MRALLLCLLTGCGYALVHPGTSVPRLGPIEDTSTEGQLGLRAAARLRRHFAGHPVGEERVAGHVVVGPDQPAGYAADGRQAFYRAEVELHLEALRGGEAVWRTQTRAAATWPRGPDPLATTTARQLALADASEAAADAAWDRYLARGLP